MSGQLKILQPAIAEFRSGSPDGTALGFAILNTKKGSCPKLLLEQEAVLLKSSSKVERLLALRQTLTILSASKNPSTDPDHLKNQLRTVEFLTSLSMKFGKKLTCEVFARIQESVRLQLTCGKKSFSKEEEVELQKRMSALERRKVEKQFEFELPSTPSIPSLPNLDEREKYWQSISVELRSKEGHMGVFYVHGDGLDNDLVVKAPLRPAQECFAARLFQKMDFLTPNTIVVDRKGKEGVLMEKALGQFPAFNQHCKEVPFERFLVMSRIYGRTIDEIDEATSACCFTNDTAALKSLLRQIGSIAAVDVLIHYQDRLPHIGYANWGNVMCLEKDHRLAYAVAIDQSVDISKPPPVRMSLDKLGRIKELVEDPLQSAKDIWSEVPQNLKKYFLEDAAIKAIYEGLQLGYQNIAKLDPKTLSELDQELSSFYTKEDFVKVEDLIKSQQIIAAKFKNA